MKEEREVKEEEKKEEEEKVEDKKEEEEVEEKKEEEVEEKEEEKEEVQEKKKEDAEEEEKRVPKTRFILYKSRSPGGTVLDLGQTVPPAGIIFGWNYSGCASSSSSSVFFRSLSRKCPKTILCVV